MNDDTLVDNNPSKVPYFKCKYCRKHLKTESYLETHEKYSCLKNDDVVLSKIIELSGLLKENHGHLNKAITHLQSLVDNTTDSSADNINNQQNNVNNTNSNVGQINQNQNNNQIKIYINSLGNENKEYIDNRNQQVKLLEKTKQLADDEELKIKQRLKIQNFLHFKKKDGEYVERGERSFKENTIRQLTNDIEKINEELITEIERIILDLFQKIHLDANHPENHNIYICNLKQNMNFYIKQRDKWTRSGNIETLRRQVDDIYTHFIQDLNKTILAETEDSKKETFIEARKKIEKCYEENNAKFKRSLGSKCFYLTYGHKDVIEPTFERTKDEIFESPSKTRLRLVN